MKYLLALLLLPSCVVLHEQEPNGSTATYASLGGRGAYRRGVGLVHDHNQSFRDAALAATAIAASAYSAATAAEQEVTTRNAARQATAQQAEVEATKRVIDNNATKVKITELTAP